MTGPRRESSMDWRQTLSSWVGERVVGVCVCVDTRESGSVGVCVDTGESGRCGCMCGYRREWEVWVYVWIQEIVGGVGVGVDMGECLDIHMYLQTCYFPLVFQKLANNIKICRNQTLLFIHAACSMHVCMYIRM